MVIALGVFSGNAVCKFALLRQNYFSQHNNSLCHVFGSNGIISTIHPELAQHGLDWFHRCEGTPASFYSSKILKHGPLRTNNVHLFQVNTLHCQYNIAKRYPFHPSSKKRAPAGRITSPMSRAMVCGVVASLKFSCSLGPR